MPLDEIADALVGHRTVVVGHSGVGKSTLVNTLVPGADRAIGRVNLVTGRGRHTSSSTVSLRVEPAGAGWVIDTPGVRSFGLGHVDRANILGAFTDLARVAEECPRGYTHFPMPPTARSTRPSSAGELGETGRDDSTRSSACSPRSRAEAACSTDPRKETNRSGSVPPPEGIPDARLAPGDIAPDFTLADPNGPPVAL